MWQRVRAKWSVLLVGFMAAACGRRADGDTSATPNVAAAREAIERANTRLADALLRGDVAAMAAIYAEEAVLMAPGEPARRGRAQLEAGLADMLNRSTYTAAAFRTDDVTMAGDLAVETGSALMAVTARGAAAPETLQLKYLTVWRRQPDGSLKIIREINNNNAPSR